MILQLYKQPFFDQSKPHEYRLLFEGIIDNGVRREDNDFYLYVWVSDTGVLTAFQAVLDNELVLEFRAPQPVSFSRISASPINRSVISQQTKQEQKRMREAVKELSSDHFKSMLGYIGQFVAAKVKSTYTLSEQEQSDFKNLIKNLAP